VGFFVDNVPVVENWMLGMCDVADCINDVRDPETIRSSDLSLCHAFHKRMLIYNAIIFFL
jgi:hypothetical protein